MDMIKSLKALFRDLSKVLLESSRVLQEAQRNYGSSVNDANESIIVDDDVHTPVFLVLATNKFAQVQTIEVEILILSYN